MKEDRSKSMRDVCSAELGQLDVGANEARDRDGYAKQPQAGTESSLWEAEAVWQED